MFGHLAWIGSLLILLGWASHAAAGYYSTIDTLKELRFDLDFERFRPVLDDLIIIQEPRDQLRNPPIRNRYILIDHLAQTGSLKLQTLDEKLTYSTVLIRRGRPDEAVQYLLPIERAYPENFFVLAHCASAHFLGSGDFRLKAPSYMRRALKLWPKTWEELKDEDRDFLSVKYGWEKTAFERNRRYEVFFSRLVMNRLDEQRRRARNENVPETVDPIFTDLKEKHLTFLNDKGEFEPGVIAKAEKGKLPRDAVDAVKQLLIWMPADNRLLWLLAEVFNASAVQETNTAAKHRLIRDAHAVFQMLDNRGFKLPIYGKATVDAHYKKLGEYVQTLPDPRALDPSRFGLDKDTPKIDPGLTNEQWWRALAVGFVTGLCVGFFALWQVQEYRRRRGRA